VDDVLAWVLADDPEGLARARSMPASGRVAAFVSPFGPVVTVEGRKLHSGRDPLTEARRFAREHDVGEATVVVVLGFGSGYIVRAIAERTRAKIVVFEPDLEVLREGVTHGEVPAYVRVVTTPSRLGEVLYARLAGRDRGVIVRWIPSTRGWADVHRAALVQAGQAVERAGLRHRTAMLRGKGWLTHYLANFPGFAHAPGLPAMKGALKGVPAIEVAAGPSHDTNMEALREAKSRALVLCVNTAATALAEAGIVPHAIVAIESLDVSTQLAAIADLARIPAFLELTAHPALWALPFATKVPISVDTSACSIFSGRIDRGHHLSAGFCVANAATSIAYVLGCDPIVLVGSDLAWAGDRVYASGTAFGEMRARANDDGTAQLENLEGKRAIEERSGNACSGNRMPDRTKTVRVPGWGGGADVTSTRDFVMFRDWYTYAAKQLASEGIVAINSTEGGAHVPGFTDQSLALAFADRPVIDAHARLAELLQRPATPVETLVRVLEDELARVHQLARLAQSARRAVADDPDGDLTLDAVQADRMLALNAETRALLRDAPLASEAVLGPVEELRARGSLTSQTFYAALELPLVELAERLARLLHSISIVPPANATEDPVFRIAG
jgi:hypothetical protein